MSAEEQDTHKDATDGLSINSALGNEKQMPTFFPRKLMLMIDWCLQQVEQDLMEKSPIEWLPDGEGFSINDPHDLVRRVLPMFFKSANYQSFIRKLYRWSFKRRNSDVGLVIYSAKNFHRDRPHLAEKLQIHYSKKEIDFHRALATKQSVSKSKITNVLSKSSTAEEQQAGVLSSNSMKNLPTAFAAKSRESMRKERLDKISKLVFNQYPTSNMIPSIHAQNFMQNTNPSYKLYVVDTKFNFGSNFVPYVIPSIIKPQDRHAILTRHLVMRYWRDLIHQQKSTHENFKS